MRSKLPASIFDTRDFLDKDKYESFKDSISVVFDVEGAEKAANFEASIKTYLMRELMLIEASTNAEQLFKRTAQAIAKDGLDHYLIQIFYEGYTAATRSKNEIVCDFGKIIVIDTSRPWEAFNGAFKNLTLTVPRRLLAPRLIDADAHHGQILDPAKSPFAQVFYDYLISMKNSVDKMSACEVTCLTDPGLDLLSAAMNHALGHGLKSDEVEGSLNYSMRLRVKQFIESNLSNSKLCAELIAAQCGVSRSYLYRLFPKSHGGVMSYARERRMNLALRRLTTFSEHSESVAEVAYATGFESESSFTRAFKSYYLMTPREARKAFEHKGLNSCENSERGRIWEQWFREL